MIAIYIIKALLAVAIFCFALVLFGVKSEILAFIVVNIVFLVVPAIYMTMASHGVVRLLHWSVAKNKNNKSQ